MKSKKQIIWRYGFALVLLIVGTLLEYFNIGQEFLGFSSVGSWMIYVAFVMLAIITLQIFSKKKRLVDERMQLIAMKAGRVTFVAIILFAFVVMIIDGIRTIYFPYSYFMSYFISGVLLVYFISYKILLRKN